MYITCPKCGLDRSKDNTRSLSVRSTDGQYVVKCFHAESCVWNTPHSLTEAELAELELEDIPEREAVVGLPIPDVLLPKNDEANTYYRYYDRDLNVAVLIHRRQPTGESKKIFPLHFNGESLTYGMPDGVFLYNADLLLRYDSLQVLVVEGEKAAEAAQQAFIEAREPVIVTTWPLGTSNIQKGDWELLRGRSVTLWPDNDRAGAAAMNSIRSILDDINTNGRYL